MYQISINRISLLCTSGSSDITVRYAWLKKGRNVRVSWKYFYLTNSWISYHSPTSNTIYTSHLNLYEDFLLLNTCKTHYNIIILLCSSKTAFGTQYCERTIGWNNRRLQVAFQKGSNMILNCIKLNNYKFVGQSNLLCESNWKSQCPPN